MVNDTASSESTFMSFYTCLMDGTVRLDSCMRFYVDGKRQSGARRYDIVPETDGLGSV